MNARYMAVSLLPLLFSITLVNAQQKYKGKLVSKLGQEQSGEITINLDGSNNELIEITYSEQTKTKGKRKSQQTTSMSMKLNVALIKHITINDTTYYFLTVHPSTQGKRMSSFSQLNTGLPVESHHTSEQLQVFSSTPLPCAIFDIVHASPLSQKHSRDGYATFFGHLFSFK